MPENKGRPLTIEDRRVIEDGIRDGLGCRAIAGRLHVAPSTVSREVETNRTATLTKRKDFKHGRNCAHYDECEEVGTACASCSTYKTRCRSCRTRKCIDLCGKFELRECPDTRGWPWTCPPKCPKSAGCTYPRMRYSAQAAQNSYEARLVSAREGVAITPEQMAKMQTERFAKSLDLSEEQQKKLYDYNLNNIKKQQEEREKMRAQREQGQQGQGQRPDFRNMSEADREAFFKQMQEQRKAQEAAEEKAYKEILTEAQYKKWQKLKKQQEMRQRQMMQQRMGGGEGGFGGPGGQGGPGGGFGGGNDMGF
jgi:flagellar biosynthesis GTPase FlhF